MKLEIFRLKMNKICVIVKMLKRYKNFLVSDSIIPSKINSDIPLNIIRKTPLIPRPILGNYVGSIITPEFIYVGEIKNGKKENYGTITYFNKYKRRGMFQNDEICGSGTLTMPNIKMKCSIAYGKLIIKGSGKYKGIHFTINDNELMVSSPLIPDSLRTKIPPILSAEKNIVIQEEKEKYYAKKCPRSLLYHVFTTRDITNTSDSPSLYELTNMDYTKIKVRTRGGYRIKIKEYVKGKCVSHIVSSNDGCKMDSMAQTIQIELEKYFMVGNMVAPKCVRNIVKLFPIDNPVQSTIKYDDYVYQSTKHGSKRVQKKIYNDDNWIEIISTSHGMRAINAKYYNDIYRIDHTKYRYILTVNGAEQYLITDKGLFKDVDSF